jgi:hypothetical protein
MPRPGRPQKGRRPPAGILRLELCQVCLSKRQAAEVHTPQVATQQPYRVDYIARPITLFPMGPMAPILEHRTQHLLCSSISMVRLQPLEDGRADQTLLSDPYEVLGLPPPGGRRRRNGPSVLSVTHACRLPGWLPTLPGSPMRRALILNL